MSVLAKLSPRMPVRDFLHWDSTDGIRYELVDGEPRAMAPPSTVHALLQSRLARLIGNHLDQQQRGCNVLVGAGVIPQLLSAHNFRLPDLAVTCAPVIPGQMVLSDPILLIEILSPNNQADTWSNVWAYTSIPTVKEILVLYSTRIAAEILRRTPEGGWPAEPELLQAGDLTLTSIGFHVSLTDLYTPTGLTA